jgi:FkbM family methyltransferase
VLWHSGLSPLLVAELPDGLKVRFYASSLSAALWVENVARNEDAEFLRLVLRPGDTYVDCGANIGHLALVARKIIGESGAVTAIEANPRVYRYCVGNLQLNGFSDVVALNVALGERQGTATISDARDDDQNFVGGGNTVVEMRTLDEVVGTRRVNLLKIDVEGYELPVLRGARRTLAGTSIVYCELSAMNAKRFGYAPGDAEQLLLDEGFVFARREGNAWRVSEQGVFETVAPEDRPATGYNLVAIKRADVADVTARLTGSGHRVIPLE